MDVFDWQPTWAKSLLSRALIITGSEALLLLLLVQCTDVAIGPQFATPAAGPDHLFHYVILRVVKTAVFVCPLSKLAGTCHSTRPVDDLPAATSHRPTATHKTNLKHVSENADMLLLKFATSVGVADYTNASV